MCLHVVREEAERLLVALQGARPTLRGQALVAEAESADDAYLDALDEKGCEDEGVLRLFGIARALAALVLVSGPPTPENACEAAYELCGVSLSGEQRLRERLERVLEGHGVA